LVHALTVNRVIYIFFINLYSNVGYVFDIFIDTSTIESAS